MDHRQPALFTYRQQIVLWAAMVCSVVMYFVVVHLAPPPEYATPNPTLVGVFTLLACVFAGASFLVKSRFYTRAREANLPALRRTGYILALVLCEAAALQGILVWFITGSPRYVWPIVLGLAGLLVHFPQRDEE